VSLTWQEGGNKAKYGTDQGLRSGGLGVLKGGSYKGVASALQSRLVGE